MWDFLSLKHWQSEYNRLKCKYKWTLPHLCSQNSLRGGGFVRRLVFKFPPENQATLILKGVSTSPLLYRTVKPTTLLYYCKQYWLYFLQKTNWRLRFYILYDWTVQPPILTCQCTYWDAYSFILTYRDLNVNIYTEKSAFITHFRSLRSLRSGGILPKFR